MLSKLAAVQKPAQDLPSTKDLMLTDPAPPKWPKLNWKLSWRAALCPPPPPSLLGLWSRAHTQPDQSQHWAGPAWGSPGGQSGSSTGLMCKLIQTSELDILPNRAGQTHKAVKAEWNRKSFISFHAIAARRSWRGDISDASNSSLLVPKAVWVLEALQHFSL